MRTPIPPSTRSQPPPRAGDADVRWLEEPVFPEDLAGLRPVHDAVTCKMATGEYGYDLPSSTRMAISNARHIECFHDHVCVETMLFDGTLDPGDVLCRAADSLPD
jgi:hypothetical protein